MRTYAVALPGDEPALSVAASAEEARGAIAEALARNGFADVEVGAAWLAHPEESGEGDTWIGYVGMTPYRVHTDTRLEAWRIFTAMYLGMALEYFGLVEVPKEGLSLAIRPEAEVVAARGTLGNVADLGGPGHGDPFILDPGGSRLFRVRAASPKDAADRVMVAMSARFDESPDIQLEADFIAKHGALPPHVVTITECPDEALMRAVVGGG